MRMFSRLVYNYKKFRLAVCLARFDLLSLLSNSRTFKNVIQPAYIFVKPSSESFPNRLAAFLSSYRNTYLLLSELIALSPQPQIIHQPGIKYVSAGKVVLREKTCDDSLFYNQLFHELATKDFSAFSDAETALTNRLLLSKDMRLYAAEQEDIMNLSLDSDICWSLSTDWIKTSADSWVVDSPQDFYMTANLTPEAGKNLVKLFAELLFDKKIIISGWDRIAVDSLGRIAFAGVDAVYPASYEHRLFALGKGKQPENYVGLRLCSVLTELQNYCSPTEIEQIFADYADTVQPEQNFFKPAKKLITQDGFGFPIGYVRLPQKKSSPSFWSRYVAKKRHSAAPGNFKASLIYWGPAFIVALILFILSRI